jgi:hypothetical protein
LISDPSSNVLWCRTAARSPWLAASSSLCLRDVQIGCERAAAFGLVGRGHQDRLKDEDECHDGEGLLCGDITLYPLGARLLPRRQLGSNGPAERGKGSRRHERRTLSTG